MEDRTETSSYETGQDAAGRSQSAMNATGDRSVVAEFVDAAQSAAVSLLDAQKKQIAARVSGMAEALEGAAQALNETKNETVGQYVHDAGQQIRSLSRSLEQRRWDELITDIEAFARRQPTWFVLGAMTVGFMLGRFIWSAATAPSHRATATRNDLSRNPTPHGTATSPSVSGAGDATNHTAGLSVASASSPPV
jgi:hypothetical protein